MTLLCPLLLRTQPRRRQKRFQTRAFHPSGTGTLRTGSSRVRCIWGKDPGVAEHSGAQALSLRLALAPIFVVSDILSLRKQQISFSTSLFSPPPLSQPRCLGKITRFWILYKYTGFEVDSSGTLSDRSSGSSACIHPGNAGIAYTPVFSLHQSK